MQQQLLTLSKDETLPKRLEFLIYSISPNIKDQWVDLGMADACRIIREWRIEEALFYSKWRLIQITAVVC